MKWVVPVILGGGLAYVVLKGTSKAEAQERGSLSAVSGVDTRGHARRIPEGYLLSGMFTESHVPRIRDLGIRLVVSLANPGSTVVDALSRAGINWFPAYLGSNFRHGDEVLAASARFSPSQVMIHCEHGVDRTGNMTAYLLVKRHHWNIPNALYAMVNPSQTDVEALAGVLASAGIADRRSTSDPSVGKYGLRVTGHSGGMKVRGDYASMVSQNIQAMRG